MRALLRLIPTVAFVIAACAPQATPAPPSASAASKVGGSVTFVATTDPDTLDLHQTSNPVSSTIFGWIYEPLVYQDLDNTYKGLLAESWTVSPDSRTITFKLRSGITFTDGTPFNADAVKFTFERLRRVGSKSPIFPTFQNVTSMEAKDATTFVMTMKDAYAPIFHDLQVSYAGILSPTAVKAANDNIGRAAVGTGPYKLKEFQTGQQITLERNADYKWPPAFYQNRGAPYIQELRYRVIAEPSTQLAALDAGEVDYLGLRAQDLAKYGSDSRFRSTTATPSVSPISASTRSGRRSTTPSCVPRWRRR